MYNPLIELNFRNSEKTFVRTNAITRIDFEGKIFCGASVYNNVLNVKEIADRVNEVEYINSYVVNNHFETTP